MSQRGGNRQQDERGDHDDAPGKIQREATDANGGDHPPDERNWRVSESKDNLGDNESKAVRAPSTGKVADQIEDKATPQHEKVEQQKVVRNAGRNGDGI